MWSSSLHSVSARRQTNLLLRAPREPSNSHHFSHRPFRRRKRRTRCCLTLACCVAAFPTHPPQNPPDSSHHVRVQFQRGCWEPTPPLGSLLVVQQRHADLFPVGSQTPALVVHNCQRCRHCCTFSSVGKGRQRPLAAWPARQPSDRRICLATSAANLCRQCIPRRRIARDLGQCASAPCGPTSTKFCFLGEVTQRPTGANWRSTPGPPNGGPSAGWW